MSRFLDIRRVLGLTQAEMGEILDCTQSNITFLDRGQTITPNVARKLIEGAAVLGVKLSFEQIYGAERLPAPRIPAMSLGTGRRRQQRHVERA